MGTKERSDVSEDTSLLLAEYHALRGEILKRMEVENQLATFTVIVFGTILGIGFQRTSAASLVLLYPTLALFFAVGWSHSAYMTFLIGTYIKVHIETVVGEVNIGWEHYATFRRHSLYAWTARGIFLMTELIAIVVGVTLVPFNTIFLVLLLRQPMTNPNFIVNALLCLAIISLILTFLILRQAPIKHIQVPIRLIKLNSDRGQN